MKQAPHIWKGIVVYSYCFLNLFFKFQTISRSFIAVIFFQLCMHWQLSIILFDHDSI